MRNRFFSSGFLLIVLLIFLALVADPLFAQTPTPTPPRTTIYLPSVFGGGPSLSPGEQNAPQSGAVYGLLGRMSQANDQAFGNYLITPNNVVYGIVGATSTLEQRIEALRDQQPPILVKVWGNIRPSGADVPLIVVSELLPGNPVATATPATPPTVRIKFDRVNLYAGPSTAFGVTGQAILNQICNLIGKDSTSTWWQIRCPNNINGWIDIRLAEGRGSLNSVPVATPNAIATPTATATPVPPTPVPTAAPSAYWRIAYFNNTQLDGAPVLISEANTIDFNWREGRPDPAVSSDSFSARMVRTIFFNPGFYRFNLGADDGVRVWLDDQIMFDEWHGTTGETYTVGRALSGNHTVRIEYYEVGGLASLRFNYTLNNDERVWNATYFNGVSLAGSPVLSQAEPRSAAYIDYNWGFASPVPGGIATDNWSARWVGRFRFDGGNYFFRATSDDGVRVYINDQLVIDSWRDGAQESRNRFIGVGADTHTIRVEYYERGGSGRLRVWWSREEASPYVPQ